MHNEEFVVSDLESSRTENPFECSKRLGTCGS